MHLRRVLFLAHRWAGILLCLFMALWFVSGVVMMYVGYPKLTLPERLRPLPALAAGRCCASPATALAGLPQGFEVRSLRLTSVAGAPTYLAIGPRNQVLPLTGEHGTPIPPVDAAHAMAAARAFAPEATLTGTTPVEEDAWTHSRGLDPHRPLWRVDLTDGGLAHLYVSGVTGEVIRDVSRTEARWNWIGAWLHWLYPLRGGILNPWWSEVIISLSLLGGGLALSGMTVGLLRWRCRPYANGSRSPYRAAWMRWHHWTGLIFGLFVFTWILSGLFSMNPWKIFDSGGPLLREAPVRATDALAGLNVPTLLDCLRQSGRTAVELEWHMAGQQLVTIGRDAAGSQAIVAGEGCLPRTTLPMDLLQQHAEATMPHARVISAHLQRTYDWHYYARAPHTMSGHLERPLPVAVFHLDDPADTWLYLDPGSGRIVQRTDGRSRIKRGVFAFLHSWDWLPLLQRRPLWDALLIVASAGGLIVSLSGVVIGWRRLSR